MADQDGGGFPPGLPGVTDYGNKTTDVPAPFLALVSQPWPALQARACVCSIPISARTVYHLIKDKDFGCMFWQSTHICRFAGSLVREVQTDG